MTYTYLISYVSATKGNANAVFGRSVLPLKEKISCVEDVARQERRIEDMISKRTSMTKNSVVVTNVVLLDELPDMPDKQPTETVKEAE
jgi:hypothetical protein